MKKIVFIILIFAIILGCVTSKSSLPKSKNTTIAQKDTVRIANDSLEYEVIIIEPGFDVWLMSTAKPRNYYSLSFLEIKNKFFVNEWNNRVMQPFLYDTKLYELRIDYDPNIHYGYEVNYMLYNYFVFFQNRYKQKL